MVRLTEDRAGEFYQVHKGKPFYDKLKAYISSGEIVAAVVDGDNAIRRVREICGATDPASAAEGTVRAAFGINVTMNSVHASDSPASAVVEIRFFFPHLD
jgi:nucleoside-diphosphate kinase